MSFESAIQEPAPPQPATTPSTESSTLESGLSRSYGDAFDDLCTLAAFTCDAPYAVIHFSGGYKDLFPLTYGIGIPHSYPKSAFANLIVASGQPLLVSDAQLDPQFAQDPLVVGDPHFRFYAGAPLVTSNNVTVGTLAVADRAARTLTPEQLKALKVLARQAAAQAELVIVNRTLVRQEVDHDDLICAYLEEREKLRQIEQDRAYVTSSARCLLWYADIRNVENEENLTWEANFIDLEAAQRFLPIDIRPGESYQDARYRARLPEDRTACDRISRESIRAGKSYTQEFRCRTLDGEIHWQREDVHVETIVEGAHWRAVGVCIDVTDSKRAQQALQESERMYRTLGEAVPDFVWSCGADTTPNFVNQRWMEYTGLTLEEGARIPADQLHHPDDVPGLVRAWDKARADVEPYSAEIRIRRHDGKYRWFLARAVPMTNDQGDIVQWIGTTTDIHERKMAEEALRQSEAQYRQLTDAMPQLAWISNADGQIEYFNRGWYDYTGTSQDEMLGVDRPSAIHPYDLEMAALAWQESLDAGKAYEVEYRLRGADGNYRWFLARAVPLTGDDGRPVKWFGTCTNVDPQTRASRNERFLAESSAALASSLDYEITLSTVARLAVPHLADWCIVHIVEAEGKVRPLAAAHIDPDKVRWGRIFQARFPATPRGVARVLETGRTELFPTITDEMLAASAQDEDHLQMLRQIAFTSQMTVPMIARGQVIGAISFVSAESGRIYEPSDVPIAEELARSTALAVDNARSFLAAQHEIRCRQETERQLRLRQEEVEALNTRLRLAVEMTHHHVRNNLQIILALTQLPIEDNSDTVPASALGRIGRQTSALAAMHDLLMRQAKTSADVDRLSTQSALERLIPTLQAIAPGREIQYRTDAIHLPVQEIGSICLLVNELVTNAIRYGRGTVEVRITAIEDMARLEVSDQGPGFPAGFDWRASPGTGLCLIDIAGRHDLRGKVTYANGPRGGANVTVEFPIEE